MIIFHRIKNLKTTQKTTRKILELIREKPEISRKEIVEALSSITDAGVKYQLAKMKRKGIIKRIGPDKGGYWEVLDNK
jgi:ATP-dependent DNA helicase RecG